MATVLEGRDVPGYSHVSNAISELGALGASTASVHRVSTVFVGLLQLAFAVALVGVSRGRILPSAAALAGVGLLGGAAFQPHAGIPLPGDPSFGVTDALHGFFGIASGLGFAAIAPAAARELRLSEGHHRFTQVMAILSVVAAVVALVGVGESVKGLVQRGFLLVAALWQVPTAIALGAGFLGGRSQGGMASSRDD